MIPKVIHYCWFGSSKKPDYFHLCKKSWIKYFPEFEIMEWNESNTDLSHPFIKKAIQEEKWAFASDYVRLAKLYEYGGIYLDTDMLFIKPFDSGLLKYTHFIGMENSQSLSAGIIGAEPLNFYLKDLLTFYDNLKFSSFEKNLIPNVLNSVYLNYSNTRIQQGDFKGGLILPYWVFYPLPLKLKEFHWKQFLRVDSRAVHLWAGSWMKYSKVSISHSLLKKLKYFISQYYVPRSFLAYARSI